MPHWRARTSSAPGRLLRGPWESRTASGCMRHLAGSPASRTGSLQGSGLLPRRPPLGGEVPPRPAPRPPPSRTPQPRQGRPTWAGAGTRGQGAASGISPVEFPCGVTAKWRKPGEKRHTLHGVCLGVTKGPLVPRQLRAWLLFGVCGASFKCSRESPESFKMTVLQGAEDFDPEMVAQLTSLVSLLFSVFSWGARL